MNADVIVAVNSGSVLKYRASGEGSLLLARFPQWTKIVDRLPHDLVVGLSGEVYFTQVSRILRLDANQPPVLFYQAGSVGNSGKANGRVSAVWVYSPIGVAVDSAGKVFVANRGNPLNRRIAPGGRYLPR